MKIIIKMFLVGKTITYFTQKHLNSNSHKISINNFTIQILIPKLVLFVKSFVFFYTIKRFLKVQEIVAYYQLIIT